MDINVEEYIVDRMRQYGENGSKSLECFGFTIEDGKIINKKCYQVTSLNAEIVSMRQLKRLKMCVSDYEMLFQKKYIRIFGVSDKRQQGIDNFRATIRLNNGLNLKKCREITSKLLSGENGVLGDIVLQVDVHIRKILKTAKYTLEQVGFELSGKNEIKERKMYFSLYKFKSQVDVCGDFGNKKEYLNLFSVLLNFFGVEEEILKKGCSTWINWGFMPILFGINYRNRKMQLKFYYLCPNDSGQDKTFDRFIYACDCQNINTYSIKSIERIMEKYDLYLKGFAYCIDVENRKTFIKPYFYPKRKQIGE